MISNLYSFLNNYFTYYQCKVVKESDTEMTVQLTRELDEVLMNRPFYWHYMDKMGREGQPMSLQLSIGAEKKDDRESIHFGSPRLQQIFGHITDNARYTLLYEQSDELENKALYPWLIANIMLHYSGKQKKEVLYSFGLHLINGTIRLNMMEELATVHLNQFMADYCYTISPLIKPASGFNRLFRFLESQISSEDPSWAARSVKTMNEELTLLDYFYENNNKEAENQELYNKEKGRIIKRLEPYIEIEIINAGIFYLTDKTSNSIINTK